MKTASDTKYICSPELQLLKQLRLSSKFTLKQYNAGKTLFTVGNFYAGLVFEFEIEEAGENLFSNNF